jgi:hypothetical protein
VEAQQAKAAPASLRPRSLAPFGFLGSEALASHLSKSPAADSRPPEFAVDPDSDPAAALLLRVSAAGSASDLRFDPQPSPIAGREGEGSTRSSVSAREGGSASHQGKRSTPSEPTTSRAPLPVGRAMVTTATRAFTATTATNTLKDSASDSRPPLLSSDLQLAPPSGSARRAGEDATR